MDCSWDFARFGAGDDLVPDGLPKVPLPDGDVHATPTADLPREELNSESDDVWRAGTTLVAIKGCETGAVAEDAALIGEASGAAAAVAAGNSNVGALLLVSVRCTSEPPAALRNRICGT